jgi:DNA-binding Lrp family transcriptional regulator
VKKQQKMKIAFKKMKERSIISMLRKNSRVSLTDISKKLEMPVSSVFNKIKKQESKRVIKKHTTIVNFQKLGYNSWSKIIVALDKEDRQKMMEFALMHKNVNSLFEINNGFDFLIETIYENSKELRDFIDELNFRFNIKETIVLEVIKDLKRERFLA